MSPGGGAADPRHSLSQGPLPDLRPRVPQPAPFTLRLDASRPDEPDGDAPSAPLYPAIVPVQQQFSPPAVPVMAKLPRLNRVLAP